MSDLNFNCDRKAKCDWTASTYNYWKQSGADTDNLLFYEATSANTLVPFGSPDADIQSRMDIYMIYEDTIKYAVEIKERFYPSIQSWTMNEGAFMNREKRDAIKKQKEDGWVPLWSELYDDGQIRVWNLDKIDIDTLPETEKSIKRTQIDPTSRKITQKRLLLAVSASTKYDRLNGEEDQ